MHKKQLEQACALGIINADQVEPLLSFLNHDLILSEPGDNEEQLRFVRSFGDIFITLGIIFVAISTTQLDIESYFNIIPVICFTATAEWLVRVRRLALPGIAILMTILYFTSQILGFYDGNSTTANELTGEGKFAIVNFLLLIIVTLLFYLRYRMPFSLLPLAAGITAFIALLTNIDLREHQYILFFYGVAIFTVAMWFDSRDTARANRYSDCGFWLHLLAAPLLVHGIMFTLIQIPDQSLPIKELLIMAFFVIFLLVALLIDRRAMLISSLSYAIYALIKLADDKLFEIENLTLFIFMAFGIFIVIFGVYWHKTRNFIFSKLSDSIIAHYLPTFKIP